MDLQQTKNIYSVPLLKSAITKIVIDNSSHVGAYKGSVDLAVPIGTPVLAGADGVIARVRDDSDQYGNDIKYGQLVNYITIKHKYGELSEYLHLAKNSAQVKVGDSVKQGEAIAKTGLSGWLTAPHLHWMVYKTKGFQCLEIKLDLPLFESIT
jgi:murein DD-endopeptidase MepM/ murein hydrolase activator NlpD